MIQLRKIKDMKTLFRFPVLFALCILGLTSCGLSRYVSKEDVANINDVALVSPFSEIYFLDGKGQEVFDESLSMVCAQLMDSAARSILPVSYVIGPEGDAFPEGFMQEVYEILHIDARNAGNLPMPRNIDMLLEENGCRYGVVLFAHGFDRDAKNYAKGIAAGVLMAAFTTVLTAGMFTTYMLPFRSKLETWIAVFDSVEDKIIFYNHIEEEASPTRWNHVERQLKRLTKRLIK